MFDRSSGVERTSERSGADDFYPLPISTLIPALTSAFDLKETYPKGHALRICAIGMDEALHFMRGFLEYLKPESREIWENEEPAGLSAALNQRARHTQRFW
jgi:hypothetical protein